jgi:CRP-like cAMP-binding protein
MMADSARERRARPRGEIARCEAVLARAPLFGGLSQRLRRDVARVAEIHMYEPGATVVKEGSAGSSFFFVLDGHARVLYGTRRVGSLGPGDFFGEVALFTGGRRTATVQADGHLECLEVPGQELDRLIERNPAMAKALLREMASRLRDLAGYRPTRMQQLLLA